MPAASVTRLRLVAGTALYHAHLTFAQVWFVESGGSLTLVAPRYWPGEIVPTAGVGSGASTAMSSWSSAADCAPRPSARDLASWRGDLSWRC
jgi:hypothetical protein